MRKRILIASFLILILTTYQSQHGYNLNLDSKFNVKKISVENFKFVSPLEIESKLSFLYKKNIFLLKNKDIQIKLSEIEFIDSFEIKKIYPDQILIKIFEKKPIAILQNKRKKYYFTDKKDLINYVKIDKFSDLPVVFSSEQNFSDFYNDLKVINFPIDKLKSVYFFEVGRWDLITVENQTVKLPTKNHLESLTNFLGLKDKAGFTKYKIFDYRISNQLILK